MYVYTTTILEHLHNRRTVSVHVHVTILPPSAGSTRCASCVDCMHALYNERPVLPSSFALPPLLNTTHCQHLSPESPLLALNIENVLLFFSTRHPQMGCCMRDRWPWYLSNQLPCSPVSSPPLSLAKLRPYWFTATVGFGIRAENLTTLSPSLLLSFPKSMQHSSTCFKHFSRHSMNVGIINLNYRWYRTLETWTLWTSMLQSSSQLSMAIGAVYLSIGEFFCSRCTCSVY